MSGRLRYRVVMTGSHGCALDTESASTLDDCKRELIDMITRNVIAHGDTFVVIDTLDEEMPDVVASLPL